MPPRASWNACSFPSSLRASATSMGAFFRRLSKGPTSATSVSKSQSIACRTFVVCRSANDRCRASSLSSVSPPVLQLAVRLHFAAPQLLSRFQRLSALSLLEWLNPAHFLSQILCGCISPSPRCAVRARRSACCLQWAQQPGVVNEARRKHFLLTAGGARGNTPGNVYSCG